MLSGKEGSPTVTPAVYAKQQTSETEAAVMDALKRGKEWYLDICRARPARTQQFVVKAVLKSLIKREIVIQVSIGRYQLTKKGEKYGTM